MSVRLLGLWLVASVLRGQTQMPPSRPAPAATQAPEVEWVCPMDKDVRMKAPGFCPRCGMKLVPGIPDEREYRLQLLTTPASLRANENVRLDFHVQDPDTLQAVREFEIMHERLYHLFLVSQDMNFFVHTHPEMQPDGSFRLHAEFPHPGLYRVMSDFYPKGGTPQLIAKTLIVPGEGFQLESPHLEADLKPKDGENLKVELVLEPAQPLAGYQTMMFFKLTPNDGIGPYLGAMAHLLVASSDLIDVIHTHPIYVTDPEEGAYKQIQCNLIFPREGMYRVWIQFQRKGIVNTVVFNVPVAAMR